MHPAALMLTGQVVVRYIEISDQRAPKLRAQYSFGYSPASAMVILVVALTLWSAEAPDVAVVSTFSPPRLVSMHDGAFPHPLFDSGSTRLHLLGLCHSVQQVHYLSCGQEQIVYAVQVLPYEAHRHSQGSAQVSNQGGDAHSYAALSYHLGAQVNMRVVPPLTTRAPPLVQLVLGDLYRLGRRQFYHLTARGKLGVLQRIAAGGTLLHFVLNRLGRVLISTTSAILIFGSFAAGLLLSFVFGLGSVGFDK